VTLILETPVSDIHKCPGCGASCAVDHDVLRAAANAGKQIRVACHKCDEVFRPSNDNPDSPARPSTPNPNTRVGICGKCGQKFSVPPLAANEQAVVECPHCAHHMTPDNIGRASARQEILQPTGGSAALKPGSKRRRRGWLRAVISFLVGGAVLAGAAVAALERITPNSTPLASLTSQPAPRLAITDTGFTTADGSGEGSDAVLVNVTLANLGTAAGAPEWVIVKLLDADGSVILRRPIASREMTLAPGSSRTLVSRMAAPPGQVSDMVVELSRD